MADDWITTREAVRLSKFHPDHLRTLIRNGRIKGRKYFVVWQVSRGSLLKYLGEQEKHGERRGRKPLTK
jgi:hypothetical protein